MNEKQIISDTLSSINAIIEKLNYSILHSNNKNIRDTFINYRNQFEELQWEVYVIAKQKQYYIPAAPGGAADIEIVKNDINKN